MAWFVAASGSRMWYEDIGAGPPLIFIHGWCMSSAVWKYQLELLSPTYRIIAVDLPGHGRSTLPEKGFSIFGSARDLDELLDALNVSGALLTGWSLGAFIAVELYLLSKCRIKGLVLIGATPRFVHSETAPYGLLPLEVAGMFKKVQRNVERAVAGFIPLMFASGESEEKFPRQMFDAVVVPSTEAALQALNALIEADMRSQLVLIDCPSLIIHGDSDRICPPQGADFIADNLLHSTKVMFTGCGHAPFITRYPLFNHYLNEFHGRISSVPV